MTAAEARSEKKGKAGGPSRVTEEVHLMVKDPAEALDDH